MTTQETRQLILDIAMNCHRIGGWIADDYEGKKKRIDTFLIQTRAYVDTFEKADVPESLVATRRSFFQAFNENLRGIKSSTSDKNALAECFMTWGNILTHRASRFV